MQNNVLTITLQFCKTLTDYTENFIFFNMKSFFAAISTSYYGQ